LYTFLQKLFNSLKSFSIPLASAGVVAGLDIILSLILKQTPLRVSGLAWANSISFFAGAAMLAFLARRKLGSLDGRAVLAMLGRSALGTLPMAALLLLVTRAMPDLWLRGGTGRATLLIAAIVAACVVLTLAAYALLRIPFVSEILRRRRKS
jgi:putative peptidoglycan lipid II flippase